MSGRRETRVRADELVMRRGFASSVHGARALIMTGRVYCGERRVDKAGQWVGEAAQLWVKGDGREYVSRGGEKLAGALRDFGGRDFGGSGEGGAMGAGLCVRGVTAADFGASTGGFVDCLLRHGAFRVHAIDVGVGLLHERLRADSRVVVWERTNARDVTVELLGEAVDLVVIDASFIGIGKLLDAAWGVLCEGGALVGLIKPQFEAAKAEASRGRGVIRDDEVRSRVIEAVLQQVSAKGFDVLGNAPCVIAGPKGNREHFVYARKAKGRRERGDRGG